MKVLSLLAILLSYSGLAGACDCAPTTIQNSFKKAVYVVEAKVVSLADTIHYDMYSNPVRPPFTHGYNPALVVTKVLKGRLKLGEEIQLSVGNSMWMCNYSFGIGLSYVVFLVKDENSRLTTSVCMMNFLCSDEKSRVVVETLSQK